MTQKLSIKRIIQNNLRSACRKEAGVILDLSKAHATDEYDDVIKYANAENWNIVCLALDTAKRKLVELGKLKQNKDACFGHPLYK